jgi:hypothetical protein
LIRFLAEYAEPARIVAAWLGLVSVVIFAVVIVLQLKTLRRLNALVTRGTEWQVTRAAFWQAIERDVLAQIAEGREAHGDEVPDRKPDDPSVRH